MDWAHRQPVADMPERFGNWSTTLRRFRDWRETDVFGHIFDALLDPPDLEYAMVDAMIVMGHRHGQGAKRGFKAKAPVAPKVAGRPRFRR